MGSSIDKTNEGTDSDCKKSRLIIVNHIMSINAIFMYEFTRSKKSIKNETKCNSWVMQKIVRAFKESDTSC